jgi:hypothetical protein
LREATAKAAASARRKLATRLSPGEKAGRKRMAELAAIYDAIPAPRAPEDIIRFPGQDTALPRAPGPKATGKWLTASVTSDIPAVIAAGFDEAERRDPRHRRTWIALVDGNNTQLEAIRAEAKRRRVTVPVIVDFVHVLEYLWKAAWSFFEPATPTRKNGSLPRPSRSSKARPARSPPASVAAPPPMAMPARHPIPTRLCR